MLIEKFLELQLGLELLAHDGLQERGLKLVVLVLLQSVLHLLLGRLEPIAPVLPPGGLYRLGGGCIPALGFGNQGQSFWHVEAVPNAAFDAGDVLLHVVLAEVNKGSGVDGPLCGLLLVDLQQLPQLLGVEVALGLLYVTDGLVNQETLAADFGGLRPGSVALGLTPQ